MTKKILLISLVIIVNLSLNSCSKNSNSEVAVNTVSSDNIFGENDRQIVMNPDYALSKMGILSHIKDGITQGHCTATLVSKSLLLTAAHCVPKDESMTMVFQLQFKADDENGNYSVKDSATVINQIVGTNDSRNVWWEDWAFLVIDKPLGELYGFLNVAVPGTNNVPLYPKLKLGGHSSFFNKESFLTANLNTTCEIKSYPFLDNSLIGDKRFYHDCDMGKGDSGGALYTCNDEFSGIENDCYIIGIITTQKNPVSDPISEVRDSYSKDYANAGVNASSFIETLNIFKHHGL